MGTTPAAPVRADTAAPARNTQAVWGAAATAAARRRAWPALTGGVVTIVAATSLVSLVGADARWLAALGRIIEARHAVPSSVPFAAADTASWPNPLVLGELIFHWLEAGLGDRGLMLAQLLAVAIALTAVALDALAAGASARGAVAGIAIASLGALPSLSIARAQLFSLALFPVAVALVRRDARRPSRRIWLLVPLLALWANLHGGVILGFAVACAYLVLARLRGRPLGTAGVLVAAAGSLCLTPAGPRTIAYLTGALTNVAAQSGRGFSAPLSPIEPFGALLIAALLLLLWRLRHRRLPLWELATALALTGATIHAGRAGVWLLLFLAAPAARAISPARAWDRLLPALSAVSVAVLAYAVARGPLPSGASAPMLRDALGLAHGTPILAEDLLDEQVVLAGGRVWVGNPIDAFPRHDQATYLDWIEGLPAGRRALRPQIRVVLTAASSPAERLMSRTRGFARADQDRTAAVFVRVESRAG